MADPVKIQVVSDLHLEVKSGMEYATFQIPPRAPYLALLGDIGNTKDFELFLFLRRMLKTFEIIFYVPGNHEPYHSDWPTASQQLSDFELIVNSEPEASSRGKFVLLDQIRYDISDQVTILGCVLYTAVDPAMKEEVRFYLNDFHRINGWTIDNHQAAHEADVKWLDTQVKKIAENEPSRQIVIFTHHSPSADLRAEQSSQFGDTLASGFRTDLSTHICWISENVKVWAFGHTHYNCDFIDAKTGKRVFANQKGPFGRLAPGFKETKTVEV